MRQCPLAISASVMTPMVFWASLVPCDNEISDAPPTCSQRKPASTYRWATPLVMRSTTEVPKVATKIAMTGEIRLGTTTLPTTLSSFVLVAYPIDPGHADASDRGGADQAPE